MVKPRTKKPPNAHMVIPVMASPHQIIDELSAFANASAAIFSCVCVCVCVCRVGLLLVEASHLCVCVCVCVCVFLYLQPVSARVDAHLSLHPGVRHRYTRAHTTCLHTGTQHTHKHTTHTNSYTKHAPDHALRDEYTGTQHTAHTNAHLHGTEHVSDTTLRDEQGFACTAQSKVHEGPGKTQVGVCVCVCVCWRDSFGV